MPSALLDGVTDPWVRTAWGNTRGYRLMLGARYEEAQRVLRETLRELEECRLSVGRPQVEWSLAAVELGLRHFARCDQLLRNMDRYHDQRTDLHLDLNARALRARLYLAQNRPWKALEITEGNYELYPSRAMYGEYLATRALALAVSDECTEALRVATVASALTGAIDTEVLCRGVELVVAWRQRREAQAAGNALLAAAVRTGVWDSVVAVVRAAPEVVTPLAQGRLGVAELGSAFIDRTIDCWRRRLAHGRRIRPYLICSPLESERYST